jgi:hypothetical protein
MTQTKDREPSLVRVYTVKVDWSGQSIVCDSLGDVMETLRSCVVLDELTEGSEVTIRVQSMSKKNRDVLEDFNGF